MEMRPFIIDDGVDLSSEVDPAVTEYREWRGSAGCAFYEALPNYMKPIVARYIMHGIIRAYLPPYSPLKSLEDAIDFRGIFIGNLNECSDYLQNEAPSGCHGSPEAVEQWIQLGGIRGLEKSHDAEV